MLRMELLDGSSNRCRTVMAITSKKMEEGITTMDGTMRLVGNRAEAEETIALGDGEMALAPKSSQSETTRLACTCEAHNSEEYIAHSAAKFYDQAPHASSS